MSNICYLVGAGAHYDNLIPSIGSDDYVIAVDGGYSFLTKHNIIPDLLLGDFDSLELKAGPGIEVMSFPPEKDYTDMMLAVMEGFKKGYRKFVILGGMGGRFDHSMANIQLLSYIANEGGSGFLYDEHTILTVISNSSLSMPLGDGKTFGLISALTCGYISVFSLSDVSEGVTIRGLKYTTDNVTLNRYHALGTSNEFINSDAFIRVNKGSLLIVAPHFL